MGRLSDKVAIVTGASKGIGGGIATALAAAGARVAVNYTSDREGAERVAQAIIDSGGEAIAVGADVSKEFQSEVAAQFQVLGLIHHAHAAATQLADDFVMRNCLTEHVGHAVEIVLTMVGPVNKCP